MSTFQHENNQKIIFLNKTDFNKTAKFNILVKDAVTNGTVDAAPASPVKAVEEKHDPLLETRPKLPIHKQFPDDHFPFGEIHEYPIDQDE